MAKRGKRLTFHGSFADKRDAVRKEQRTKGAFIRRTRVKGHTRYTVITRKD